jgi:hypothetical protein
MITKINEARIAVVDFLGTDLINRGYFFADYWAIVHLLSGFVGMFLICRFLKEYKTSKKFILLFAFIFLWEIFEFSSPLVKEETTIDIVYDFVTGIAGGFAYYLKKTDSWKKWE